MTDTTTPRVKKRWTWKRILLWVFLVWLAAIIIVIPIAFIIARVPVPTSQGEITRSSVSYSNSNGYKVMNFSFATPDWIDDADYQVLAEDICNFVKSSDWSGFGVNAQNADEIAFTVRGGENRQGFEASCSR